MEGLLLDNWTLESITNNCIQDNEEFSPELIGFIESLVLWDKLYYFDNGFSSYWKKICTERLGIKWDEFVFPINSPEIADSLSKAHKQFDDDYSHQYNSVVAKGALEYLYISQKTHNNYMPFGKRAEFVRDHNLFFEIKNYFDRSDIIQSIDEHITAYYNELNSMIRKARISFCPHSLFEFINQTSNSLSEMITNARLLAKHPCVVEFKKWVSRLEDDISAERFPQFNLYKDELNDIENQMISLPRKNDLCLSASLPASIEISVSIPLDNQPAHLLFPAFLYKRGISPGSFSV